MGLVFAPAGGTGRTLQRGVSWSAALAVGVGVLSACGGRPGSAAHPPTPRLSHATATCAAISRSAASSRPSTPAATPFPHLRPGPVSSDPSAVEKVVPRDGGRKLVLDGQPAWGGRGLTLVDEACVLKALNVPDRVLESIDHTTITKGVLRESWDGLQAAWAYSPNEGLDIIVSDTA